MKRYPYLYVVFLVLAISPLMFFSHGMAGSLTIKLTDGYQAEYNLPLKSFFVDEGGNLTALINGNRSILAAFQPDPIITISNISGGSGDDGTGVIYGTKDTPLSFTVAATTSATDSSGVPLSPVLSCLFPTADVLTPQGASEAVFTKTYYGVGTTLVVFSASFTEGDETYTTQRVINIKITEPGVYYELAVAANPAAGGSVTGAGSYLAGTYATVTATANTGYTFSVWTGVVTSAASSSTTVYMDGAKSVTANFTTSTPPPPGSGDGTRSNPIKLNQPMPKMSTWYGYNLYYSTEYKIPKGSTIYFEVDPIAYTGTTGSAGVIKIWLANYQQTTNVKSKIIAVNTSTGLDKKSYDLSGDQVTKLIRYTPPSPPDERYLIECTENGTKDQNMSVWWSFHTTTYYDIDF